MLPLRRHATDGRKWPSSLQSLGGKHASSKVNFDVARGTANGARSVTPEFVEWPRPTLLESSTIFVIGPFVHSSRKRSDMGMMKLLASASPLNRHSFLGNDRKRVGKGDRH